MKSQFPKAGRIADPTVKYNCHSYAWYKQSTSNPYWIDNAPDVYMEDGSYTSVSGTPKSGYKAYYNSGEHSGVVAGIRRVKGEQVIMIRSKWGATGLYIHRSDDSPYSSSIEYYKRAQK